MDEAALIQSYRGAAGKTRGRNATMVVNFLASGVNGLLLPDGDAYAVFLAPLVHDFPEFVAPSTARLKLLSALSEM